MASSSLLNTRWSETARQENVWYSYPRPRLKRKRWQCLNGEWEYAITAKDSPEWPGADGKIRVPFAVEWSLSGVEKPLTPDNCLWYRRSFGVPAEWRSERVLLNFEAVDWSAEVWVNGKRVGEHQGGYDPFGFDISPFLKEGENELVIKVVDPTDQGDQPRGKQALSPEHIWYRATSGIWQTVWLEPVPEVSVAAISTVASVDGLLDLGVIVNADDELHGTNRWEVEVTITRQGQTILQEVQPFIAELEDPWLGRAR
ncbi:MAG: sugar-binding domain-containing protein, partial [Fimbriimonadaceae bacterium]